MLRRNKLSNIEFNYISDPSTAEAHFAPHSIWALPQLMAFLVNNIKPSRNSSGLFSFAQTFSSLREKLRAEELISDGIVYTPLDFTGIIQVLRAAPRGTILGSKAKQSSPSGARWSAAVPLFCSAYKELKNIKYSEWDWKEAEANYFLDKDMLEYSAYFNRPDLLEEYSKDFLLDVRERALEIKSGAKAGSVRKPESTTAIYGLTADPLEKQFSGLPRLVKLALTQLWVFDPKVRHSLAITNPLDIDVPAEPLIPVEVTNGDDLPWNMSNELPNRKTTDLPWDL